ncbi:MAG: flagellar protein FlgN [Thermanaerothrix sp.]|nr:flagellar protein FlgN [Thermanaerothrix sp.]
MDTNPQFQAVLEALEKVMVRQFNLLQELLNLTRAERDALYRNDTTLLMPLVERKEALLDQIVLLEDQRRMETERLSQYLRAGIGEAPSLQLLFPHIPSPRSERIQRLSEGILSLADQVRQTNEHNALLVTNAIEWVSATQAFILGLYTQPEGYSPTGQRSTSVNLSSEVERTA